MVIRYSVHKSDVQRLWTGVLSFWSYIAME